MTVLNENYPKSTDELKQQLIQQHASNEVKKNNFPTEVINLPSKGLLYSESSPLRKGYIEMKYMTAAEEDILSTPSLAKRGLALDRLFQALIVTPINYNELIEADKDSIMIAARMLGYGPIYKTTCVCPICDHENKKAEFDLKQLKETEFNLDNAEQLEYNSFKFVTPTTNRVLTFKLLTHGDSQKIELELEAYNKKNPKGINKELTTKLKHIITSVDGDNDKKSIQNFVDNEFFAVDSLAFREHIRSISPKVDFTVTYNCPDCLGETEMALPMGLDFFWPRA